jgi:HD-GYP domain-containing protein (c-di-GMP phosphodiesterase class II)
VRRHPEFGWEVVRNIPALATCAPGVLSQLEHYDGTGAPLGVRSTQIPLISRIIAVANAYDVMTHPRTHGDVQSSLEALQEIEACAGTQFDPDVVADLLAHFGVEPRLDEWPHEP